MEVKNRTPGRPVWIEMEPQAGPTMDRELSAALGNVAGVNERDRKNGLTDLVRDLTSIYGGGEPIKQDAARGSDASRGECSAAAALQTEQQLCRCVLESALCGIAVTDLDGRVAYVNKHSQRLLGYDQAAEMIGRQARELFLHPEECDRLIAAVTAAGEQAQEVVLRRKNNQLIDVHLSCSIVRDAQGRPLGLMASGIDVTPRKRAEKELAESREQLQLALRGADLGLWDWHADGTVFYDERWAKMLGYEPGEIEPHLESWLNLIHPDDRERCAEVAAALAGAGDFCEVEHRLRAKSGEWKWILSRGGVLERDKDGRPLRAVGTHLDLSARKNAEEALRRSEARYRELFESSVDGIAYADVQGRIVECNPAFVRLLGRDSADSLCGRHYSEITPAEYHELEAQRENECRAREASENRANFEFEKEYVRGDGSRVPVALVGWLSRDAAGTPTGMWAIVRDISERKRMEREKEHLQSELRHSQKLEAIGRLAGGIAHDFNNILTGILGYSELMLLSLDEQDPLRADASEVHKAAERAAALTNQLLAFSRKQLIAPVVLDIAAVVYGMRRMLERLIGESIEINFRMPDTVRLVRIDPVQVEQILVNLAINARDAMPAGGMLTVALNGVCIDDQEALQQPDVIAGNYAVLSVADTGQGITEEVRQRIFEPFFTTKESGKGTGLGLATVYGIVKQNNGFVTVASEVGRGSCFNIHLPLVQEEPEFEGRSTDGVELCRGAGTVLVVEDEETIRDLTKRMLQRRGYQVFTAARGEEALAIYRSESAVDLVITDLVMPGMNGADVIRSIREINPKAAFVYMSGYPDEVLASQGLLDLAVPVLKKPFTGRMLLKMVDEALSAARGADDSGG